MAELYVIRNQLGHYWGRGKCWVDGADARAVKHSRHRDEAVNILFELSSKDFELRGEVLQVEANERGDPVVEASQIPLPMDPVEPETQASGEVASPAREPEPAAQG
jgi:hypothetical protein